MPQNFYEMLGVDAKASVSDIRLAYQRKLGRLVHRKREAENSGASLVALEREERDIREALSVLVDNRRKQRYDAFRRASEYSFPTNAEDLWKTTSRSVLEPVMLDAIRLAASLTKLPLQEVLQRYEDSIEEKTEVFRIQLEDDVKTEPRIVVTNVDKTIQRNSNLPQKPQIIKPSETRKRSQNNDVKSAPKVREERKITKTRKTKYTLEEIAKRYGYMGAFFQAVRENQSLSIAELAQKTRIPSNYIMAIEQDAFSKLPSSTYVRGYIKTLLRALQVPKRSEITDNYMKVFNQRKN